MMMMMHQKAAKNVEAHTRTWVIWDINTCPVPTECDASRVGSCFKRALKNLGYTGHVTITAIGILTEVPDNILQSVSSTGIVLDHTPTNVGITIALFRTGQEHPPPCNILVISQRNFSSALKFLEKRGYYILPQVFYDYGREAAITSTE